MKDERFLHPLFICDVFPRFYIAFRVRNKLRTCTSRQKKTLRKQFARKQCEWEADTKRRMAAGEHFSILPSSMYCECGHCVETILERQSPGIPGGTARMAAEIRRRVANGESVDDAAGEIW